MSATIPWIFPADVALSGFRFPAGAMPPMTLDALHESFGFMLWEMRTASIHSSRALVAGPSDAYPSAPRAARQATAQAKAVIGGPARDPRLPEPGTVLKRHYAGVEHEVTVLADGFDFRGARHRSLSKVAREITGTPWNGFSFFGLSEPARSAAARGAS